MVKEIVPASCQDELIAGHRWAELMSTIYASVCAKSSPIPRRASSRGARTSGCPRMLGLEQDPTAVAHEFRRLFESRDRTANHEGSENDIAVWWNKRVVRSHEEARDFRRTKKSDGGRTKPCVGQQRIVYRRKSIERSPRTSSRCATIFARQKRRLASPARANESIDHSLAQAVDIDTRPKDSRARKRTRADRLSLNSRSK
jgi:hypothetical protein